MWAVLLEPRLQDRRLSNLLGLVPVAAHGGQATARTMSSPASLLSEHAQIFEGSVTGASPASLSHGGSMICMVQPESSKAMKRTLRNERGLADLVIGCLYARHVARPIPSGSVRAACVLRFGVCLRVPLHVLAVDRQTGCLEQIRHQAR